MAWSASSCASSSWDRPSRLPKTYSLYSPRQLAGIRMIRGVLDNFHAMPGYRWVPASRCVTYSKKLRSLTCGSS